MIVAGGVRYEGKMERRNFFQVLLGLGGVVLVKPAAGIQPQLRQGSILRFSFGEKGPVLAPDVWEQLTYFSVRQYRGPVELAFRFRSGKSAYSVRAEQVDKVPNEFRVTRFNRRRDR